MRLIVTTPDGVTHRVRTCEAAALLVRRGGVIRYLSPVASNAGGEAPRRVTPPAFDGVERVPWNAPASSAARERHPDASPASTRSTPPSNP